jgi:hypothetical protein
MEFFLVERGSCSYDDERIGDIEVPLKYKNLVKQWIPDLGGYRWPPTFSDWLKSIFWQFWQFTIFSRF